VRCAGNVSNDDIDAPVPIEAGQQYASDYIAVLLWTFDHVDVISVVSS
jgi:hypothetical protein